MPQAESYTTLPSIWRSAPRRWGHPLHSMCSYMAMFPPAIPHVVIRWLTEPGDVVFDPFSGRGTTALEACLLGRTGYASDANPLACVLTGAKVNPPSEDLLFERLAELRQSVRIRKIEGVPPEIRMLFSKEVLGQLLSLRGQLDLSRPVDRFLMACLLGGLHANADSRGVPRGLTVSMPNTFSMAPGYVSRFIKENGLIPPKVDVVEFLASKAIRLIPREPLPARGSVRRYKIGNRKHGPVFRKPAKLIFASPPYLNVIYYGKFNWIRLWMLGACPRTIDADLFTSGSLTKYLCFMSDAIRIARSSIRDDGFACFVIGDVRKGEQYVNLSKAVAENCVAGSGLKTVAIIDDELPTEHKVSRIWGDNRGRATKTDRLLLLAGPKARVPKIPEDIDWLN